jgi:hypothetical protein
MIPRTALLLASALASASAMAQTCQPNLNESTPAARFVVNADKGTVLDKATGLMWKQCSEGQGGPGCAGNPAYFRWTDALIRSANSADGGYSDWRLPNIKELQSLVEEKCSATAINLAVFPNTPAGLYWTGSPYINRFNSYSWIVNFDNGTITQAHRASYNPVRLVRGGQ